MKIFKVLLLVPMLAACASEKQVSHKVTPRVSATTNNQIPTGAYKTLRVSQQRRLKIVNAPNWMDTTINAKVLQWYPEFIVAQGEITGQLTKCQGMTTERANRLYTLQVEWLELANLDQTVDESGIFDEAGFGRMLDIFNKAYRGGKTLPYLKSVCNEYLDDFETDILDFKTNPPS